jgi:HEAT repeat protein
LRITLRIIGSGLSGRVMRFVALAAVLATANTYGSTLAAALFLNRAGATAIPLYYVLYAAVSIPVSVAFTQVIDRWPRAVVFTALLGGGALLTAAIAPIAGSESKFLFFALYVVISVFEQLSYSVFYVLLADYFTSVETNRSTTAIAVGMALGGFGGGALAGLGTFGFSGAELLFGMPLLLTLTGALFVVLRRRTEPLGEAEPQAEESMWRSLAAFLPLLNRYPIVALLAVGVFLNIVVQSVIEYQVFVIYAARFPDERALTGFLGALNGVLNVVNIVTSLALTGPLLTRIGVARMNLVYPAMTVGAFAALGASFSLPAAVFGHVVYDPWAHSVDAPVFVSNYNAVPHRFIGRVRIFNDGLMYPLAMALAGAGLWLVQDRVSPGVVTAIGLVLAVGFLACGFAIRNAYAHGLMEMLRSGSLDLDAADGRMGRIPPSYYGDIRRLLASSDERSQTLGLELAARADARVFLREIQELLSRAAGPVRSAFVRRFAGTLSADLAATIATMLTAEEAVVRAAAAEALVAADQPFAAETLLQLMADPAREVAAIAAIEAYRRGVLIREAEAVFAVVLTGPERLRLRAVQVIRRCLDPELLPLLARLREGASLAVLTAILEAAAELGRHGAAITLPWARRALGLEHSDGALRRAAYRLLAACGDSDALAMLAAGLGDSLKEVRSAAAVGLASHGEAALPLVREALGSGDDQREDAAIEAAGRIGGPEVSDLLYRHLTERYFAAVRRNGRWFALLPSAASPDPWAPLAAALRDSNRRALDVSLAVLDALGYRRTLKAMRGILAGGDVRARANAVETIASIGHRRFVQPLLPMLEMGLDGAAVRRGAGSDADRAEMLAAALIDQNHWIRAGAVLCARRAPPSPETDLVVIDAVAAVTATTTPREPIMNRLLFLKSVPLFEGLSLDDVLSVDAALGQEEFLAGETVVRQGEPGTTLFLLARGTASVRLGDGPDGKEVAQLQPGDFFGEMSLFDDQPRSATVVAITDATLLTLERDRFATLVLQRPDVLLQICKMFGSRLRETNRRLLAA